VRDHSLHVSNLRPKIYAAPTGRPSNYFFKVGDPMLQLHHGFGEGRLTTLLRQSLWRDEGPEWKRKPSSAPI
jgi:hypothetical protein